MQQGDLCEWDEVYVNKGECEVAGGSLCEGENELVGGFSFESFYKKYYALEMERMWYYGLCERERERYRVRVQNSLKALFGCL